MTVPKTSSPHTSASSQNSYEGHTVGGLKGHLLRRAIHLGILVIPILYYSFADPVTAFFRLSANQIVLIIMFIVMLLELLRLRLGWVVFGQRKHEAKAISSFAWTGISIGIVLLFAPDKQFGFPIIWSCALGDPLLGELRRCRIHSGLVALLGVSVVVAIWLFCSWWLNTPIWLAWIMGPLTVAAEWPNIKWLDDNVLMTLLPLIFVLIVF